MYYNDRRVPERQQSRPVTERETTSAGNPEMRVTPNINQASPLSPTVSDTTSPMAFPMVQQGPPPVTSIDYIPGYLASIIGKNVKAEFILGASQFVDQTGKMMKVGVNYFVLQDINSRTEIMCDLYSVKFVTVLNP